MQRFAPVRPFAIMLVLAGLAAMTGCASPDRLTGSSGQTDDAQWQCHAFAPITWAQKDTPETRRQVEEHNAVWIALCS